MLSSVILTDVFITHNFAFNHGGGAFLNTSSNATFTNLQLLNNQASTAGGGIYAHDVSDVLATNLTMSWNSAPTAGGMYLLGLNLLVSDSEVSNNNATGTNGGGLVVAGESFAEFVSVNVLGNTALGVSASHT